MCLARWASPDPVSSLLEVHVNFLYSALPALLVDELFAPLLDIGRNVGADHVAMVLGLFVLDALRRMPWKVSRASRRGVTTFSENDVTRTVDRAQRQSR